jgi:hypothetical protein
VIDGRDGANFVHALEIYEKAKGLKITKGLDDKVWSSLLAESGGPVLMEYVLTDQNVEGPFFPNLPKDYGELAKLKAIGYRNPSQNIGAMFHMGEDLLATLNPGVDLSKAGTKILVAEVKPQPIHGTLKTIVDGIPRRHARRRRRPLLLADRYGWRSAYLCMAALMTVGAISAFVAPEPESDSP